MTALWVVLGTATAVLVAAALLPGAPAGSGSRVARVLIAPVRVYQRWISPALPPTCRFAPSCSAYAAEALRRHGAVRGTALAAWRLLRCHPWHPGGLDPVPPVRRGRAVSGPARPPSESEPC